jgi:hypothetical protein
VHGRHPVRATGPEPLAEWLKNRKSEFFLPDLRTWAGGTGHDGVGKIIVVAWIGWKGRRSSRTADVAAAGSARAAPSP